MCLDFINGFQEFGRDIVSKAQLNPGPQVRAHLFAKRQRLEVDEMDPAQSFLDHEVRDHEHSGMVRKCKVTYTIENQYSDTANKKTQLPIWDAAMKDPPLTQLLTNKIKQNENFSITILNLTKCKLRGILKRATVIIPRRCWPTETF